MVERVWEARASGDVMESFGWRYRVSVQRKQWTAAARRTGRAISKMETAPTREAAREICNAWDIEERQVPLFAEVPK